VSTAVARDVGLYCTKCGRRYNRESIDFGRCTRCSAMICSLMPPRAAEDEESEMRETLLLIWRGLTATQRARVLRLLHKMEEE
jgi:hypothetical protein